MKVYTIIQASGFTSETQITIYSTREKAQNHFQSILNTITMEDIEESGENLIESFKYDNDIPAHEELTAEQADKLLREYQIDALKTDNFVYMENDVYEEVTILESEVL